MRVLIAGLSAPTELNGVSRHAANLARGLLSVPQSAEIHFVAGAWQSEMFARAIGSSDERLVIHSVPIPHRNHDRVRWYYRELPRMARRLAADVVHLSYTMPLDARAFACPTIVSLHDLYPFDIPENFGFLKGVVNRELMHHCLRNVDAIACVSGSTRARLRERFGARLSRKAVTILNAVEPVPVAEARPPRELRTGEPFLLCIAQHRQNKNIPLALDIFERLVRNGLVREATRLLLVGIPGPDTPLIQARIREGGLEQRVVHLSGISDAELQWCYRHCELLLAPSSIEGFGLPVAEAMLAGCPVVCSDIAAFREIGGGHCRYVRFGENVVERYEAAVRETLAEPRPEPRLLPRFSPAVIAREYLALYTRLLASRCMARCEMVFYAEPPGEEPDAAEAR
jgi:glycosyltransferase involved in cell wall biosynthesis